MNRPAYKRRNRVANSGISRPRHEQAGRTTLRNRHAQGRAGEDARGVEDRELGVRLADQQPNLGAGQGKPVAVVTMPAIRRPSAVKQAHQ